MTPVAMLACEPIPALLYMWAGPNVTLPYLGGAAGLLAVVVALKCGIFAALSPLGKGTAISLMFIANIVSTVIGVLIGGAMGMGSPIFGVFFVVFASVLIAWNVCQQLAGSPYAWLSPLRFVGISFFLSLTAGALSYFLPKIEFEHGTSAYFLFKFLALFLGLLVSIPLTIFIESATILSFSSTKEDLVPTFRAALHANIWTFLIVFLIGALIAIPIRRRHPGWLYIDRR